MPDSFIQLPPDSTGKLLDTTSLTVGVNTVQRERVNIADPTSATAIATVTAANALKVDNSAVTQPVSGTVTANVGTTGGLALDATLTGGNEIAIVKGGAKGTTAAAVLTSNPVDANTQALHVDGSKVTQPVSGTVTANQGTANATPWNENVAQFGGAATSLGAKVGASSIPVVLATDYVSQDTVGTTAALNALNTVASVSLTGRPSAGMFLAAGTLIGTILPELSLDGGTTWVATMFSDPTTGAMDASVVFAAANGNITKGIMMVGGASNVRVRVSAFTSGTANCTLRSSSTVQDVQFFATNVGNTAPPNAILVGGTDGTNLQAAKVKAASTAAVAADVSLVVALSPNSPLPTGTNTIGALTANQSINLAQVAGTATVTAAAGVAKVGIVGNANAVFDAPQNATAPANELVVGGVYNTTIPALTAGRATQSQADSTGSWYVNIEGRKKTYSAFATFTPVAGDIAVLPGNATNVVRVTCVQVSLSTTGTAGVQQVQLVKRSTADTAGTSAAMTAVPHDSNFAAAVSAPLSYTAAPTLGTAVGTVRGVQFFDESATVTGTNTYLWMFGDRPAAAVVLRGTAQELCVNLGGVTAVQTVTVSFEWSEE